MRRYKLSACSYKWPSAFETNEPNRGAIIPASDAENGKGERREGGGGAELGGGGVSRRRPSGNFSLASTCSSEKDVLLVVAERSDLRRHEDGKLVAVSADVRQTRRQPDDSVSLSLSLLVCRMTITGCEQCVDSSDLRRRRRQDGEGFALVSANAPHVSALIVPLLCAILSFSFAIQATCCVSVAARLWCFVVPPVKAALWLAAGRKLI